MNRKNSEIFRARQPPCKNNGSNMATSQNTHNCAHPLRKKKPRNLCIRRDDVIMLAPKPPLQSNNTWTRVLLCWTHASFEGLGPSAGPHTQKQRPPNLFPLVHFQMYMQNLEITTPLCAGTKAGLTKKPKTCSCKNWFHWAGTDMALPQHQYNNN